MRLPVRAGCVLGARIRTPLARRQNGETVMNIDCGKRLAGIRKRTLIVVMALMAPLAVLGVASPALATPTGDFAIFSDCPVEVPSVTLCNVAQTTSGEFAIGSTKVPINQTITLQGGLIPSGTFGVFFAFPAKDGNSLSKTELNVPGGLLNLIHCEDIKGEGFFEKLARGTCKAIFENKTTGVTATTELVASATNPVILNNNGLLSEEGTALTLPVRIHLKNPLLGSGCYIGSEASPIQLQLTTGTTAPPEPNKPISGKLGFFTEEGEGLILVTNENSLVDNAFSVPAAEGCGGSLAFLINPIVNTKIGLPSTAGHNTAILNGTLRLASKKSVIASE